MRFSLLSILGLGLVLGLALLSAQDSSVAFQSLESKTETGAPVFNEIKFKTGDGKDIWIMRQSHHGYESNKLTWDRLAIVIDKTVSPKKALFYQLKPGNLDFTPETAQPLGARCLACHANGPRAIRYDLDSKIKPIFFSRFLVAIWNLRIKTYGPVESVEARHFSDGAPFRAPFQVFSHPLPVKSCTRCHSSGGIRNALTYEQVGTAAFLVKNKFMPPWPFRADPEDAKLLQRLLYDGEHHHSKWVSDFP